MAGTSDKIPDLEAVADLMQRAEAASADVPELKALELDEVLRVIGGKRAIFTGRFNGRPAIHRFYMDEPRAYAKRDWEELNRTWPYMSSGPYRVNRPLFHYPDLGLIVVKRVSGKPMLEAVWQSEKEDRAAFMPEAVKWLRHYTQPTETRRAARASSWLTKAEKRMDKQAFARLRPMLASLQAELHRLVPALDGQNWRIAISHGDFHPNNLLVADGILTGIDTGGSARLPIYKDMARFLAHMGRRGLHPSETARFGVDAATFDHFVQEFELDAVEREIWLPFMIGIEALLRVETAGLSRSRVRRAQMFFETLLDDLRSIDV